MRTTLVRLATFVLAAALLTLVMSSCGSDEAATPTTTSVAENSDVDQTTTSAAGDLAAVCTADSFSVEYPADWETNGPEDGEPCRFFHPGEVDVPKDSEAVGIAVHLRYDAIDFEFVTNPDNNSDEVLDLDRSEIDGRPAVRMHLRSTGDGLLDAGVESIAWFVDAGETVFTGATHGVAEGGVEVNGPILDEMMRSLRFTGGAAAESE